VPIDVRRFGVGHRRPDGPPGTTGIEGQVIESGPTGVIAELAFSLHARIAPHSNPNWTYFVVIEGGGWVGVGDERTRVLAGEAAVWPPNLVHAAWTDGTQMRAIVVELTAPSAALGSGVVEGVARAVGAREPGVPPRSVTRGEGSLAPRPRRPVRRALEPDDVEGEPL
jgi:quercetin dioxygenase-like cupin family protein